MKRKTPPRVVTADGVPVELAERPSIRRWAPRDAVAAYLRMTPDSPEAREAYEALQLEARRLHRDATNAWLAEQQITRADAGRAGLLKQYGCPRW